MRESAARVPEQEATQHDRLEGLGRTPRGPAFTPWQADLTEFPHAGSPYAGSPHEGTQHLSLQSHRPLPYPALVQFSPPASRLPAILTGAVVLLVTVIAAVATLMGIQNDARTSGASPAPVAAGAKTPPRPVFVEFSTADGSGRLVVIGHSWRDRAGKAHNVRPSLSRSYLRVEVELVCDEGFVEYNPYFFQAFDATGQLFDMAKSAAPEPALEVGSLTHKETVRGFIAFNMPRGAVTLLMSDATAASVVAIRISD